MTEEEQGGTAPQPEATASAADEAPEQTAAAVAVADEPAETEETPTASAETDATDTADVAMATGVDVNGTVPTNRLPRASHSLRRLRRTGRSRYHRRMKRLLAYLQLCRFAAVFTALADICMGWLLTQPDFTPERDFALLLISSAGLYLAGMVFNDVFDRRIDARERPNRPIPSGRVPLRSPR